MCCDIVAGWLSLQWEKLQRHSEEVRERAETAECQIATISQEYRKLIQEKDVCENVSSFMTCVLLLLLNVWGLDISY